MNQCCRCFILRDIGSDLSGFVQKMCSVPQSWIWDIFTRHRFRSARTFLFLGYAMWIYFPLTHFHFFFCRFLAHHSLFSFSKGRMCYWKVQVGLDHHNDDMIKRLLNGLFLCQPELQRLKKIIVMPFQNGIILKFVVLLCSSCIKSPVSCYCYSSFIFSATPDLCQLSLFTFLHCRNPPVGAEVLMVYSHSVPYMYTELQLLGSNL